MVGVLCPKTGAIVLLVLLLCTLGQSARDEGSENPHIFVVILARNQEHTLRNFLGYLERLDYPKHRMSVWWVKIITVSRAVVYRRAVDKRIRDKRRLVCLPLKSRPKQSLCQSLECCIVCQGHSRWLICKKKQPLCIFAKEEEFQTFASANEN